MMTEMMKTMGQIQGGWEMTLQKRNVEDSLRGYVVAEKCRRASTDKYSDNPPRNEGGMVWTTVIEDIVQQSPGFSARWNNCL